MISAFPDLSRQVPEESISFISPAEAARLAQDEGAVLIDISETEEYRREHINGSRLAPASALGYLNLEACRGRSVIFLCRTGRRTNNNTLLFAERGFAKTYIMEGGLEGWKNAGLPVIKLRLPPKLSDQVLIAMGAALLVTLFLTLFIPQLFWLAVFLGAGQLFAGLFGICALSALLGRMPWNKDPFLGKTYQDIQLESCSTETGDKK